MSGRPFSAGSIAAAGALAVLTLTVFVVARDQGPLSAVKRFHEAAASGDPDGLARTTLAGPASAALAGRVRALLMEGPQISVGAVESEGRRARVDLVYSFPEGFLTVRYQLTKPTSRWLIDARDTISQTDALSGL